MSDKISLPIVNMRAIAQQAALETTNLISETEYFHQQILNTKTELPGSMQAAFDTFLEPFHRNLLEVLALRRDIAETLSAAADVSVHTDESLSTGFQSQ
jgi:hypothetical protein